MCCNHIFSNFVISRRLGLDLADHVSHNDKLALSTLPTYFAPIIIDRASMIDGGDKVARNRFR